MLPARLFDGRSSGARVGELWVDASGITFRDAQDPDVQALRRYTWAEMTIAARLGDTPRNIHCTDGALLEVTDNAGLDAALAAAGREPAGNWLHLLESRWHRLLLLVLAGVALMTAFTLWGVPAIVRVALPAVPLSFDRTLGDQVLATLYSKPFALEKSTLDTATQQRLATAFQQRLAPLSTHQTRVHFVAGGWIGANALALPGGHLVVTDELVNLAQHDEEVLAVLAHELGHEEGRHSIRMLLEGLTLLSVLALITGDLNSVAVAAPYALITSRSSRSNETEADHYAHRFLHEAHIPATRLGDILLRLETARGEAPTWALLLSSHPTTRVRVQAAQDAEAAVTPMR